MSFQVGSACYPTELAAAAASASSMVGAVVSHAGSAYAVDVSGVTASTVSYTFTPISGGAAVVLVAPYTPQPCGLMGASDAVQLGWLVGGAWVIVYCVKFLARIVRDMSNDRGGDDGNA